MASAEKFCLRWNDFESNVSTAFRDLREEKDFFDVTLACDDSQVEAHKVILAACSPFFRNVLKRNPHQHPLLYLKGVKYKELVCVLNFMYQGEVNVAQEELNSFLAVAEDLRVKGLTQGNSSGDSKPKSEPKPPPSRTLPSQDLPPPPAKRQRPTPAPVQTTSYHQQSADDDDIQEVVPVKSEPGSGMAPAVDNSGYVADQGGAVALEDSYNDENYDYGGYGEGGYDDGSGMIDPNTGLPLAGADGNKDIFNKTIQDRMVHLSSGLYGCSECDYTTKYRTTCLNHIESKHLPTNGFICNFCEKFCPTRNALKSHVSKKHNKTF